MIGFLTPYQREYLSHPLTLHAADLPADIEERRAELEARIDEVFAHVPKVLPSHRDHPQWNYHFPGFIRSRHESLSKRLGLRTTRLPPPDSLSALDQAWWRLDGLEKSYSRDRQGCIGAMQRDLEWLDALLAAASARIDESKRAIGGAELDREVLQELAALAERTGAGPTGVTAIRLDGPLPQPMAQDAFDAELRRALDLRRPGTIDDELLRLEAVREMVKDHYERRLLHLDSDYEARKLRLRAEYERLMPRAVAEAAIPHIAVRARAAVPGQLTGPLAVRLGKKAYHKCFGRVPRVTQLNPLWAPLRHVARLVDAVAEAGGSNVFVVSSQASAIERLTERMAGNHARAAPAVVLGDNFALAFDEPPDFDLCLCILEYVELSEFPGIVKAVTPCMRPGGKIVGFHMNASLAPLSANDPNLVVALSRLTDPVQVHFAGSAQTAEALAAFQRAAAGGGRRLARAAWLALALMHIAPRALAGNRAEAARHHDGLSGAPAVCTSLTLEVTVGDPARGQSLQAVARQMQGAMRPAQLRPVPEAAE
jgi:hypothetical protein